MNKALLIGTIGGAASLAMLALGYQFGNSATQMPADAASAAPAAAEATLDKGQVEQIVHNYLVANPEVLLEVQTALEAKREQEQRVAQTRAIEDASDEIFNASYDGLVGNPDGKVTIVEFFDYNCGFCKRAIEDMNTIVSNDDDVRFVLKEFPILGPDSRKAHVVSMAFRELMPEQYSEFHRKLLGGPGRADENRAIEIALELGADEGALREAMKDPKIEDFFAKTYELANQLSITGTPSYVVGDEVVFGALGEAVLSKKVANLRDCQKATC